MNISPDTVIYWQWGPITINATLVSTWLVMALLVFVSWLATRKLTVGADLSRWQNAMEAIVDTIRRQIHDVTHQDPTKYLAFLGTFRTKSRLCCWMKACHCPRVRKSAEPSASWMCRLGRRC